MFILLWSIDHDSPGCLPIFEASSADDEAEITAMIAAILNVFMSAILSSHKGIFPCFLAGRNSSFSNNMDKALANFILV